MDRTAEWQRLCAAAPRTGAPPPPPPPPPQAASLGEFHAAAATISREIQAASQKLGRLRALVRSSSLFSDPAEEISLLVHDISEDVSALNSKLESAETYVQRKRAESAAAAAAQPTQHSVNVVGQLRSELVRCTKAFKAVIQQRSASIKAQRDRRGLFGQKGGDAAKLHAPPVYAPHSPPKAGGPPSLLKGPPAALGPALSFVPPPPPPSLSGGGGGLGGTGLGLSQRRPSSPDRSGLYAQPQQQQQELVLQPLIPDAQHLESRASAVTQIESHIVELGSIFNRLSTMVVEQDAAVQRIDENVEDANANVEGGHLALLDTLQSYTSGRRLGAKVGGVLVGFALFFVVFVG